MSSYGAQSPESGFYDPGVFRDFIEQFMDSKDEEGEWEERLDVNDGFSWISLILLLVPNLQYLNMRWTNRRLDQTVPWIVDKMANRSPAEALPLQRLRKVSANSGDIRDNSHIDRFIPFLKLPTLYTLQLAGMHDDTSNQQPPFYFNQGLKLQLKPGRLEVRELSFRGCNFQHGLSELLSACARLESFEYQHCNQVQWGHTQRGFRCRAFREGLLSQKHCLRVLRLNDVGVTRLHDIYEDEEFLQESRVFNEQAWFGGLAEFEALESLRIPVWNLLDSTDGEEPGMPLDEVLPPGLETLVLTKVDCIDYSMLERQLKRLLQCKATRFPKLKTILLQPFQLEVIGQFQPGKGNWGVPERAKTVFADVAKSCKLQGIDFGFSEDGDYVIVADGVVVDETDNDSGRFLLSCN